MINIKAEFVKSASKYEDCVVSDMIQIAVVGKSNVGKSSFINMLANNSKLARTSKDPGRTRLINYFMINDSFWLTDLPGYGYAKVSLNEKQKWAELIDTYLAKEPNLAHVFFLVDGRHDPTNDDLIMYNYLFKCNIPFTLVATKADKLSKSKIYNAKSHLANIFKVGVGNVIATSAETKLGRDQIIEKIQQVVENTSFHQINEDIMEENCEI